LPFHVSQCPKPEVDLSKLENIIQALLVEDMLSVYLPDLGGYQQNKVTLKKVFHYLRNYPNERLMH
jgi:hypothetical protein